MQHKSWIIICTIYATLVHVCLTLDTLSEDDKIVSLPGQPQVSFRQYGGYITIDEKQQRALFYYFAEAETEPASKPLVLWLNGGKFTLFYLLNSATYKIFSGLYELKNIFLNFEGPGCSSIGAGAFCEHGPFRPSGDILVRNYYSWNKGIPLELYLQLFGF